MKEQNTKVKKTEFDNENAEENLSKNTPVEGVNMEEDKKRTSSNDSSDKKES